MEKLTYIYHDCFLMELPGANLVFDYWRDAPGCGAEVGPSTAAMPEWLAGLDPQTPLVVLVSHHHKDHFTRAIFGWASQFCHIHYVLSKDTWRGCRHVFSESSVYAGPKVDVSKVSVLKPGESADIFGIKVRAFGSTDIGNSYVVEACGRAVMHSGDLNAWIWKDESTPAEVRAATDAFVKIAQEIADAYPELDYCMFPVDARIGTDYFTGARMLVRMMDVRRFFPMHFELAEDEAQRRAYHAAASRFSDYANPERGEYIALTAPLAAYARGGE